MVGKNKQAKKEQVWLKHFRKIIQKTINSVCQGVIALSARVKNLSHKGCCYFKHHPIKEISPKNKSIAISFIGLVLMISLVTTLVMSRPHKTSKGPDPLTNLSKINTMQNELGAIESKVTSTSEMNQQDRQAIEAKLQTINNKLNSLSTNANQTERKQLRQLHNTLQSSDVALSQKITALATEMNQLKTNLAPKPTLSQNALPFAVVSVDVWNGKPYAELAQRNNTTMIDYVGLYQSAGGWKVIAISAPEQTVVFENVKKQVVRIQIKPV